MINLMNTLWTYIDDKKWRAKTKYNVILLILGSLFGLAGFCVWLVVRNWAFSTIDWMLCFIGVPVLVSWYIVVFYSCRHVFSDLIISRHGFILSFPKTSEKPRETEAQEPSTHPVSQS